MGRVRWRKAAWHRRQGLSRWPEWVIRLGDSWLESVFWTLRSFSVTYRQGLQAGKGPRYHAEDPGRSSEGSPAQARTGGPGGVLGSVWPTYLWWSGRTRTQTATTPSSAILPGRSSEDRRRRPTAPASESTDRPAFKFKISQTPRGLVTSRTVPLRPARGARGRRRVHGWGWGGQGCGGRRAESRSERWREAGGERQSRLERRRLSTAESRRNAGGRLQPPSAASP